ncbi:MAG: hypothetical protein PUI38_07685, partial [Candidatus Treponema excrementipullorum]|nr:hypothetical protein [Candidatus Treponema excrementipullorum]MDY4707857.1 hypothetical protein [Candidatus Treponema excrementipullorum]
MHKENCKESLRPRQDVKYYSIVSGQTHVKIFCFKSLNYYLKNAKNGKIPLGGVMLLRESLEEIDDFRVK